MNSLSIGLNRLDGLVEMASSAKSAFEKAAVFAAATVLTEQLETELHAQGILGAAEIAVIRSGICGAIGYDTAEGCSSVTAISMASSALRTLRLRLEL